MREPLENPELLERSGSNPCCPFVSVRRIARQKAFTGFRHADIPFIREMMAPKLNSRAEHKWF